MKPKSKHSIMEKFKRSYACKECKKPSEEGYPYWTFGRCKECKLEREKKNRDSKRKPSICLVCKKHFLKTPHCQGLCSNKCLGVILAKKRKGQNNPAFRNGLRVAGQRRDTYKEGIFRKNAKLIKDRILEANGYLFCQMCGTSSTLRWETHHIIYRSEAPRHRNLHELDNLLFCCIQCHNNLHSSKASRASLVKDRQLYLLFPEIKSLCG